MTLLLRDRLEGDLVIEVAFTGSALDVGDRAEPSTRAAALAAVAAETAATPVLMHQVHGADVTVVPGAGRADSGDEPGSPTCDALATTETGMALLARVADCVPVLLGDPDAGVVAAVHSGRAGLAAGVVPAAVARMRDLGARRITAWVGPHVCGACYEVPEDMRAEVAAVVPESWASTRWDTPGLDLGAGVHAQLDRSGVLEVHDVGVCTLEDDAWPSHRRDGLAATRFAGVVWMHR